MAHYRHGGHSIYEIKYHFVWVKKYRYKVLQGSIAYRLRELLKQGCEAKDIEIIRGSISKDHVYMLLSCPATLAPSKIAQYLKGRSSHLLQDESPKLKKRYWEQHMWARSYFCGTVGQVDEETIRWYVESQSERKNFTIVGE